MHFTKACVAAGLLGSVLAHPVGKRTNALPPVNSTIDESVLQLALYLEHLELSLYTGGYVNFTDAEYTAEGFPPGFRENVGVIAQVWRETHQSVRYRKLIDVSLARASPLRYHQRHPHRGRLHPNPPMFLPIPIPRPEIIRRSGQRHHFRRHRCVPRRQCPSHRRPCTRHCSQQHRHRRSSP